MYEEKRIEQEIGWYKVVFAIFMVTDLSLLAWLGQNLGTAAPLRVVACIISIIIVTAVVIFFIRRVFRCLDRLAEL